MPVPAGEQLPPADRRGGRGGRTSGQHLQDPVLLCLQQSPRRQRPLSRSLLRFASRRRCGQRTYRTASAQSAAAADRSPLSRKSAKHPSSSAVRPVAAAIAAAKFIRCRRIAIRHVFLFVADRFAVYFRRPAGGQWRRRRGQRWRTQSGSWTAAIGRHHGKRRRPSEPWRQRRRREHQPDPRRQQRRGGSGRACEPPAAAAL